MAFRGVLLTKISFVPMLSSQESLPSSPSRRPFLSAFNKNPTRKLIGSVAAASFQKDNHSVDGNNEELLEQENGRPGKFLNFSGEKPVTPILDTINFPIHMKNLSLQELESLANELREEIVYTVSKTGGHLSASLGVAELTVALHHVFNTPEDKIIWDVGHQAYAHKILTGRRSRMHTIRQTNGLAGFPKRDESVHDAFGAGHSSNSISAGLGMAYGRDLLGKNNHVISVIGDGAMTAGQAYEAINNAGALNSNLIIILNDNSQVSLPTATVDGPAPPVGALSRSLSRLQSSQKPYQFQDHDGKTGERASIDANHLREMVNGHGTSLFEELGLYYVGPINGHSMECLLQALKEVKLMPREGPVLIHILTEKGKGYPPAEIAADKMHGVVKFDPKTGKQFKAKTDTKPYTNYFADALIAEAEKDDGIVAIHAAMGGGTGLNLFAKRFPNRCFDVGIAEQHAVTFAAGLATEGLKPFCAIYSSFLQRGYDQVVHDVDIQKLPVRFAMDRAGLVGADGPTHCGAFDTTFMACLPNMIVMAPADETELMHMVATAAAIEDRPSCFRYPRGNGIGVIIPPNNKGIPLEIGKGRILVEGTRVAILGYGTMVQNCLAAAKILQDVGISATVADARFCKPLDGDLIKLLAREHEVLVTVEEGSIGGFSSHISHFLAFNGILDTKLKWGAMMLPDRYIEHGAQKDQIEEAGLTPKHIAVTVLRMIGGNKDSLPELINLHL